MNDGIQVVGRSDAARAIACALARQPSPVIPVTVVAGWDDLQDLHALHEESRQQYLLIENSNNGHVAVGPVFDPEVAGCFECYLARRRANGGCECRPPDAINSAVLDRIRDELKSLISGGCRQKSEQVEFSPSGKRTPHAFLPVPGCASCSTQRASSARLQLEDLVSSRLGLIHEIRHIPGAPEGMVGIEAIGCRTDAFGGARALNKGMALADSELEARRRAIAESIERYCASLLLGNLPLARPDELEGGWLNPSQFPTVEIPRNHRSRLRWVKATMLCSGEDVWAPASLVYVPYEAAPDEAAAEMQFSVGLAAGESRDSAIRHGLAEIVERDVCLRAWRMNLPVEAVQVSHNHGDGLHITRVPNDSGLEVAVAFLEQPRVPLTSTGLGARLTLAEAARHAVVEAFQSRLWLEEWLAQNPGGFVWPARTMIDNAAAHALCPDLANRRREWLYPPVTAQSNGLQNHWKDVLERFPGACWVDITSPDVQTTGLSVVRVLAPGRFLADDDMLRPRIGGCIVPHPFG